MRYSIHNVDGLCFEAANFSPLRRDEYHGYQAYYQHNEQYSVWWHFLNGSSAAFYGDRVARMRVSYVYESAFRVSSDIVLSSF